MAWTVTTKNFSGPFDLLLHLVSTSKLSLEALSISDIARQYQDELLRLKTLDLEVASDFILVAATLLDLKAKSLVPAHDASHSEDALEDIDEFSEMSPSSLRELLVTRLLVYKQMRDAAQALGELFERESSYLPRETGPDPQFLSAMPDFLHGVSAHMLAVLCADIDSKKHELLLEASHVAPKRQALALTAKSLDRLIRSKKHLIFSELIGAFPSPDHIVVNFLALLELFKQGIVSLSQETLFSDIHVDEIAGAAAYKEEVL